MIVSAGSSRDVWVVLIILFLSNVAFSMNIQKGSRQELERVYFPESIEPFDAIEINPEESRLFLYENFVIIGKEMYLQRFLNWIQGIEATEYGRQTLQAIKQSSKVLLVRHSTSRLHVAGTAVWEASTASFDGRGVDVEILFDARIPQSGSHMVGSMDGGLIEFKAIHNFFHELSHARHALNGTLYATGIERQAISDTNIFRDQLASLEGGDSYPRSFDITEGKQVWFGL